MNLVTSGCVNPDGSLPDSNQQAGLMYSPERRGILIRINCNALIHQILMAPQASQEHCNLIEIMRIEAGIKYPAKFSDIS